MATIKSIEEKAKAYDEAIEKLRRLHDDYDTVSTLIDIKEELEHIFPELAESEDERIRKEIITYIKWCEDSGYCAKEEMTRWITFLEKQGEQKQELLTKEKALKNSSFVEQKPAEWTAEDEEELKIALDTLEKAGQYSSAKWLKNVCLVPQTTQKPTKWSEEDKKNIDFLIHLIEHNVPNHSFAFGDGCAYGCKSKEEAINMLKSIKERVQPQPKQEWSEEDEDIKETIIGELELVKKSVGEINYNGYDKLIDWLKSLRPQNRWKPSDEQMRELSIVATGKGWFSKEILSELLEQLKKLREE